MSDECDKLIHISKDLQKHIEKIKSGIENIEKTDKIVSMILKENSELRKLNDSLILLAKQEKRRVSELIEEMTLLKNEINRLHLLRWR